MIDLLLLMLEGRPDELDPGAPGAVPSTVRWQWPDLFWWMR